MKEKLSEIKGALLTGVSYMLPFVIAGGILIALGFAIGGYDIPNSVEEYGNFASTIFWLGKKAFALMVPVLGAYVAYSIADSGVPITYTMIKPIAPTPMIGIISVGSSDFNAIGRLIFFNRFTR